MIREMAHVNVMRDEEFTFKSNTIGTRPPTMRLTNSQGEHRTSVCIVPRVAWTLINNKSVLT